jgi:N-acetyl-anhydromuramyl-L-alanine amidase AmpD
MDVTVKMIDSWHKERGWAGIGYHYLVKKDSSVHVGRPKDAVGAHVKGYNQISVGICLEGGWKGQFDFTRIQMQALEGLISALLLRYKHAAVYGHRDLDNRKQCPGFDVNAWWYNDKTSPASRDDSDTGEDLDD